jgi:hypothetical protein
MSESDTEFRVMVSTKFVVYDYLTRARHPLPHLYNDGDRDYKQYPIPGILIYLGIVNLGINRIYYDIYI